MLLQAGPQGFPIFAAGVLGLLIGSFLNVVVYRLPRGESVVRPASHCPHCDRPIPALENVPLLSYLLLRGRCRGCRARISLRYPLVELLTAMVFALLVWSQGLSAMTPLWLGFGAAVLAAGLIDFDHRIIPDGISLGGLAVGLVAVPVARHLGGQGYGGALLDSLLGAFLGGGLLWVVGFAHARISSGLGRRFPHWPEEGEPFPHPRSLDYWTWFPGLGFGDVKLLAMIGAFVGPLGVAQTLFAAAVLGLLLGLGWAAVTRSFAQPFGFAPAIALGALAVVLLPPGLLPI